METVVGGLMGEQIIGESADFLLEILVALQLAQGIINELVRTLEIVIIAVIVVIVVLIILIVPIM